ncbi:hypothetical protein BDW62DRAFT_174318 [Aspergillus aurantiobrunneus]
MEDSSIFVINAILLSRSYLEASNSNSTPRQPLVYVPRVGPALRTKLTSRRDLSLYRLNINQDIASLQYLALAMRRLRSKDEPIREY